MTDHASAVIGLYERHALAFARDRLTILFERGWLDRFLALVPADGRVLDLGCGMGDPMARYLIAQGRAVTGVDASAAMISLCAGKFADQEWIVADMRGLALGRVFDGILAWDSFFHLAPAAQRAMFAIFAAHARPGAPLLFTSGLEHGEALGSYQGEVLYHASLAAAEYRTLLAVHGFDVVRQVAFDPDCDRHCVWLARRM